MVPRVATLILSLISISALSQASPIDARDASKCDLPSWTIQNLNITYSDDIDKPGSTTFTLVDSLTKKSDVLSCPVPFNSIGRIEGTPSNKDLRIRMSFYVGSAFVEISQNLTCAEDTTRFVSLLSPLERRQLADYQTLAPHLSRAGPSCLSLVQIRHSRR